MKSGIRILAIDDAKFSRSDKKALSIGVLGRTGNIDGVLSFSVGVDGTDATRMVLRAIKRSRFRDQIKLIAFNGITLGGLNLVDMPRISRELEVPVLALTRKKPHTPLLRKAIVKVRKDYRGRVKKLDSISKSLSGMKSEGFYVQYLGIEETDARKFVRQTADLLRLAHMIARSIISGESKGRL